MALDYLTYYSIGFIWGMFLKKYFFFSITMLAFFTIFFKYVFGEGPNTTLVELELWLPLSAILGLIISTVISYVVYIPALFVVDYVRYEWYTIKLLIEFLVLHILLVFWELLPISPFPWGGLVAIVAYIIAFIVIYWLNRNDHVWCIDECGRERRRSAESSFFYWAIFFITPILFFTIVVAISSIWNFWLVLVTFIVSAIILCIIEFFMPV